MPSCSRMCRSSLRIRSRRLASSAPRGSSRRTSRGSDDQRPGERDALLLAAGDLVDAAVLEACQAHELQHFQRARAGFVSRQPPDAVAQPESDIVEDGKMRKEREILKHEADAAQ